MSVRQHRLSRAVAGALAASALAAPAAGALPAEQMNGIYQAYGAQSETSAPAELPAPTVTRSLDEGFDWGSAAMGAGGAAGLLLAAGAGASALSHRRRRMGVAR